MKESPLRQAVLNGEKVKETTKIFMIKEDARFEARKLFCDPIDAETENFLWDFLNNKPTKHNKRMWKEAWQDEIRKQLIKTGKWF